MGVRSQATAAMRDGPSFQVYYALIDRHMSQYLDKQDAAYLLSVDKDDYLDFLVQEASWEPLEWDETGMTVEPFKAKVEQSNAFGDRFVVDVERLRLRIPVSPHSQREKYFEFMPSTIRLQREPDYRFEGNVLILEADATERAVQEVLEMIRFWLGNRNEDIEKGNATLKGRIRPIWEARRKRLEESAGNTQSLLQKLNIPLHQDPNARAKPVEIKRRQLRTVVERPKAPAPATPALDRDEVHALVQFIEDYTRQFETAPTRYVQLGEEGMRDLLVGMLNANYPGSATAETFSKLGKTDISFRVNEGHVLVCECKLWGGAKAYGEAIDQLFRYVTWRQNYGVLIHFCTRKDMGQALTEAKRSTSEHPSFTTGSLHDVTETRFVSRHAHPQDSSKSIEVHHLFVDLSV
ncbi:MAG TPA: hypothetical protein VJB57_08820 [Dehalococcoidia bacterium]|nr:hypothetical protein [Dehalococcoidia bacterium]